MSNSNPLPSSFDGNTEFYEENRFQKLTRRLKEEPLIPIGCILTSAALLGASRSIRAGDHNRTQRMFRARILAQAFTLVAMVAGSIYWDSDRKKRKEFEGLVEERKRREKNEAWIRELEARDEEEREIRAQRERRRARAEGRTVKESVKGKVEGVVENGEEKGKGVLDSLYGLMGGGGKSSPEKEQKPETKKPESQPPKEAASSMIDGSEIRRLGVLEMVQELVNNRRN